MAAVWRADSARGSLERASECNGAAIQLRTSARKLIKDSRISAASMSMVMERRCQCALATPVSTSEKRCLPLGSSHNDCRLALDHKPRGWLRHVSTDGV